MIGTVAVLLAAVAGALLPAGDGPSELSRLRPRPPSPPSIPREPWWPALAARRRAPARRRQGVIELCSAAAAELGVGSSPRQALAAASQGLWLEHLGEVAAAPHGDVASALRQAGAAPGAAGLLRLEACWRVCERSGAPLAPAVAGLADALRDDEQVRREVGAQLAGPRATAVLLALLPAFGLLLGGALGGRPVAVLLGTPLGRGCLLVGLALEVAGLLWTRRLTHAALPT
ncbi:MAG: tight adherence protein [Frankiaceae bacterium]|nr:tight adherence protein [Frankiaceae bacterium]